MPDLAQFFVAASEGLNAAANDETLDEPDCLDEWLRALRLLRWHKVKWFSSSTNQSGLADALHAIETAVTGELRWTWDDPEAQADHLRTLSMRLSAIQAFLQEYRLPVLDEEVIERCDCRAEELEARVSEAEEEEVEVPSRTPDATEPFDLNRFFADL